MEKRNHSTPFSCCQVMGHWLSCKVKQRNDLAWREAGAFIARHQWLITQRVRTCYSPDRPSSWANADFSEFVSSHRWVFARTMPQNPHEYTLRRNSSGVTFDEAVRFTRQHGHIEYFKGGAYRMIFLGDYKYCTTGSPLGYTILINRKGLADDPVDVAEAPPAEPPLLSSWQGYLRRENCEGDIAEFARFAEMVSNLGRRRERSRTAYLEFEGDVFWVVGSAAKTDMIWRARMPPKPTDRAC